jgi:serine/threonine protein kinase
LSTQPLTAETDVLGYKLLERIGSGGFGEVWSAEAPGGILKALKIVYGFHDEKRAQAELKALDRVKALRHPFLLNLERIEVYESQLVVVTELADQSMADLFNEYLLKGEAGIPRDLILRYTRDAGDALDYMSDSHQLQHLDIKPENLLMVSGHVKVADFGLIKDLQNASQSLMQGMTPAYAAPELFDGRPGKYSDQYSLAIVYQEMLSGVRPFSGNTPAQLAAQHMHGKPDLRSLPKGDISIIAKALAKDPELRFNSCREMAEELLSRKRVHKKVVSRTRASRSDADTESGTVAFDQTNDFTAILKSTGQPIQAIDIETLDPPECDETKAQFRPTLVIGVGATANRVAQKIKQQMTNRHSSMAAIPAFKIFCIDCDRSALSDLSLHNESGALGSDETLAIPLRKPEAYRDHSTQFKWLSRRWIYNVPRTLQTEGLRPLGRLAFADHFDAIWDGLSEAIDKIVLPENVASTCDTLDLDPGEVENPRVIIVSTISGGLGSGMTLDLAYALRVLLSEKGLKADSLTGILMHAAYRRQRDPGLAAANAFAFMTEMRHFNDDGYPGDESIGLPEFEQASPFEFTYFKDLGRDLKESDFDAKLDGVAEYVGLSTISRCNVFLDACRAKDKDLDHFALRSFGLSVSGPGNQELGALAVNRLSRGLLSRWIFGHEDNDEKANQIVNKLLGDYNLSYESIFASIHAQMDRFIEQETIQNGCAQMKQLALAKGKHFRLEIRRTMDEIFGATASLRSESGIEDPVSCLELENFIGHEAIKGGDELSVELINLLDSDSLDLSLVNKCVKLAQDLLGQWSLNLGALIEQEENLMQQTLAAIGQMNVRNQGSLDALLGDYFSRRKNEFLLRFTKEFARVIQRSLNSAIVISNKFKSHLQLVASQFPKETTLPELESEDGFNMDYLMNQSVHANLEQQIERTEIQVYESLIRDRGGFLGSLNESSVWQQRLPTEIRESAQRVLADAYQKLCLDDIIVNSELKPEQLIRWLNEKLAAARPEINNCGGAMRLMLGLPTFSQCSRVAELVESHFHMKQKSINGTYGNFVLIFECEDVSLASVAFRLLEDRPDAIELVKRIHTRTDVQWRSLSDLL